MSTNKVKKVVVCGGGNAAHVAVGMFSVAGYEVDLFMSYSTEADDMVKALHKSNTHDVTVFYDRASQEEHKIMHGKPHIITKNPSIVIPNADLILIIAPANSHEIILRQISPYLKSNVIIGATPAPGGFNMLARHVLEENGKIIGSSNENTNTEDHKDITIFGVACLPWVCRIDKFGESVHLFGTKSIVDVNVCPSKYTEEILKILNHMYIDTTFRNRCKSFLHTTLYPHNCIIHPGIMYGLFSKYNGSYYDTPPLFYQNMDENTASTLEGLSNDITQIAKQAENVFGFNLFVPTLKELMLDLYPNDIEDKATIQTIFKTNRQYDGLTAPMQKLENDGQDKTSRLVPNFQYRYLTEDLPHGLVVLKGIAEILGVQTPTMNKVILWGQEKIGHKYLTEEGLIAGVDIQHSGCPQRFGINTIEDLRASAL